jgi:uncharacterized protein YjhX (UPF0386 family)
LQASNDATAFDHEVLEELKKRKLVSLNSVKYYRITKGVNYSETKVELESELTAEMLRDGSWSK